MLTSSSPQIQAKAVGKIPSGLLLLSSRGTKSDYSDSHVLLVSWVQQVSFKPLLLTLALNRSRENIDLLLTRGGFGLHVLGEESRSLISRVSKTGLKELNLPPLELSPPDGLGNSGSSEFGLKLPSTLADMECAIQATYQPGDHILVVCEVLQEHIHNSKDKPLVHIRAHGLGY